MASEAEVLGRLEKLERDTRMLKRACAILLALLAAGVMVTQTALWSHISKTIKPNPETTRPAPSSDQR